MVYGGCRGGEKMSLTIKWYPKEDVSGQGVIPYFDHDDGYRNLHEKITWNSIYIRCTNVSFRAFKLYYSYRIYNHWEKGQRYPSPIYTIVRPFC